MKYTEYTIYPKIDQAKEATEKLTALGQGELIINDPNEIEELPGASV